MNIIKFTLIIAGFLVINYNAQGQGCVAIRNMSCNGSAVGSNLMSTGALMKGDFALTTGYRYFKSFRHYRGDVEEKHRVEEGTEVINYFHAIDLGVSYGITNRLSTTLILPFNFNDRSSMYEHYGNSVTANPDRKRFNTGSAGLGDLRLSLTYWLREPGMNTRWNVAWGVGLKAPTGDYEVIGDFHKLDDEGNDYTTQRPVDQSIQLGDGGWGVTLEGQGFVALSNHLSLFYSGFYMSSPANHNGVLRNPTSDPENPFNYFSIVDQYAFRLGLAYVSPWNMAFNLGSRIEGIPSADLIGSSDSYRRPGYAVSVEPGLNVFHGPFIFNASVPIAVYRNRIKSQDDKNRNRHGDAAFADYVGNISLTYFIPSGRIKQKINIELPTEL